MIRIIPIILTLLVLLGLAAEQSRRPAAGDVEAYHARVAAAVKAIPLEFNDWQGADEKIPPEAIALLKPNVMIGRRYTNRPTRREAMMYVIQSRDTRDLNGHYPPICYPAHGWQPISTSEPMVLAVSSPASPDSPPVKIPLRRYEFSRRTFDRDTRLVAYCFFVLPSKGLSSEMDSVTRAGSDLSTRGFGACQVQVVMGPNVDAAGEADVLSTMIGQVLPVLEKMKISTASGGGS